MVLFKRVEAYKKLSECPTVPRKYDVKVGKSTNGTVFDTSTPDMNFNVCREVVLRNNRPYDVRYSLLVHYPNTPRQKYNGLFAMLMFNLSQKKHNAGKQK